MTISHLLAGALMLAGSWLLLSAPEDYPLPPSTPSAQSSACRPLDAHFAFVGENPRNPVVPRGPGARWDGKYINPGAVLVQDGVFHMFRNGFKNWPGDISVGHATSPDGQVWSGLEAQPVLRSGQVPFAAPGVDVSSALVTDEGTWVLYFHTVNFAQSWQIGRASAPSPQGPWAVDPQPVLSPGPAGAWDERHLMWPSVVRTEDGYAMLYGGQNNNGQTRIGLAVSTDGVRWEKYDDPSTTQRALAQSDPVLAPGQGWDAGSVNRPEVQRTPDGWVMVYQGGGDLNNRGLAFSTDGVVWKPHPDNPVLTQRDFPNGGTTWDTALVFHDGAYHYFMEIGSLAFTNIFLAVHQGPLCGA